MYNLITTKGLIRDTKDVITELSRPGFSKTLALV